MLPHSHRQSIIIPVKKLAWPSFCRTVLCSWADPSFAPDSGFWRQIFIFLLCTITQVYSTLDLDTRVGSPRPRERPVLPGSTRYLVPGTKMNSWIVLIMYGLSMYTHAYTWLQKRCRNHQFVIHDFKFLWGSMMLWWVNSAHLYTWQSTSIIKSAHIL